MNKKQMFEFPADMRDLAEQNVEQARVAYGQLKRICGDSLRYDPEAEAELRASQITVLERRVFP